GIPIVTSIGSYTEFICKAIGDAAIGNYDVGHWTPVLEHKENVEFLAGYEKFTKEKADDIAVLGFDVGTVMTRALDQTGGDTDNEKLVDVIAKLKWIGPRGECSFGPNHAIIHPTYVRRVEKVGGILMPIVAAKLGPHTTPGGADGPGGECKM
ncbi:MAG: ABC transporter substrate-binding protein, partial [Pseudomonadota bacterium]